MLERLRIRNFALIDELELDFRPGLNVLTGETGAGKSILVSALGFLLGQRSSSELVRSGARLLEVEGVFSASAKKTVFRRELDLKGRTRAFLDGRQVPVSALADAGSGLVDFHGQHDHQSLLRADEQRALLDRFGRLEKDAAAVGKAWESMSDAEARLGAARMSEDERERFLDLARYQLAEIESAAIKEGEEEELQSSYPRLKNSDKIARLSGEAYDTLFSEEGSAVELVSKAAARLAELADLDPALSSLSDTLSSARISLEDAASELRSYRDAAGSDPARLEEVIARLEKISALKKKYGAGLPEIEAKAEELRARIDGLENAGANESALASALEKARARFSALASELHAGRLAAAKKISKAVEGELGGLGFAQVRFSVSVEADESSPCRSGIDSVEFLFCPNPGEPPRPLRSTASGGELSRVMLGLKTVLAGADRVPVMVFDEVDTGVGAVVGRLVGGKLARLAAGKQVFCVTHLPQVAAFGGAHFFVEKTVKGGSSSVGVRLLDVPGREAEIARMLGGKRRSTDLGLEHARELLAESAK
ncbi:MAG: DNA repair protein RecN [Elusimicrobiales bacterium]|nr:DNA repair protein RecN [Elusimicrobiales bacterium]